MVTNAWKKVCSFFPVSSRVSSAEYACTTLLTLFQNIAAAEEIALAQQKSLEACLLCLLGWCTTCECRNMVFMIYRQTLSMAEECKAVDN